MKVGFVSDVHGNLEALEAALELLEKKGVDTIKGIGDYVGYMTNPMECLDLLKSYDLITGNHDHGVLDTSELDRMNEYAYYALKWTKNILKPKYFLMLRNIPYVRVFESDGYTVVHGSLYQPKEFNYIFSSLDAKDCFELQNTQVAFVGHSHRPYIWKEVPLENGHFKIGHKAFLPDYGEIRLDDDVRYIFNVGSIGQPRDGNPKGCVVTYDTCDRVVEYERFDYDRKVTIQKMIDAGMPMYLYKRLVMGQ